MERAPLGAPNYALWLGGRLGVLGFGNAFFENDLRRPETTGNYLKSGPSLQLDIGARLSKRYVPYVGLEVAALPVGRRFDGTDAHARSTFLGVGLRLIAGDVDTAGFVADLSFGIRTVTLTRGDDSYSMRALEIFRLGLGAEIRVAPRFTLSPMFQLSGGQMVGTDGRITYAAGQGDGLAGPSFQGGTDIEPGRQMTYLVVGIGCGAHFDLFGR